MYLSGDEDWFWGGVWGLGFGVNGFLGCSGTGKVFPVLYFLVLLWFRIEG